jgi:hypothetical protein
MPDCHPEKLLIIMYFSDVLKWDVTGGKLKIIYLLKNIKATNTNIVFHIVGYITVIFYYD